jgi:hypothetical protein
MARGLDMSEEVGSLFFIMASTSALEMNERGIQVRFQFSNFTAARDDGGRFV